VHCSVIKLTGASRLMLSINGVWEAVRNQMEPQCAEWWCETDNQAITPFSYSPSTAFLPVRPQCANARWNRCQES